MTPEELQLHDQLAKAMIKIHNLHIALNKKVDKNKNQALEITKLLEQKKDLQDVIDLNYRDIKRLESNLSIFADSSKESEKMLIGKIEELQLNLKEKDTIISYLESKLK